MTEQISKAAAERLKAEFYKHRERFEDGYGYKEWCAVIDSMTEPDHEWKVDEWAMVDEDTIIRVKQIGTDWIHGAHLKGETKTGGHMQRAGESPARIYGLRLVDASR